MTLRLTIDDEGLVTDCPFRGTVPAEECTRCANGGGIETRHGRAVAVCRAASRWFPNQNVPTF